MNKHFRRREPENYRYVEIKEQWQITYWTLELGTTQEKLTRALKEVGPDVSEVRAWLEKKHPL